MPIGIIGSLRICTVLFILYARVFFSMANDRLLPQVFRDVHLRQSPAFRDAR